MERYAVALLVYVILLFISITYSKKIKDEEEEKE